MPEPVRTQRALARISESNRAVDEATAKLDRAIEACSTGVPVRIIDDEDSLAVSMETERVEAEGLLATSRSRRALIGR